MNFKYDHCFVLSHIELHSESCSGDIILISKSSSIWTEDMISLNIISWVWKETVTGCTNMDLITRILIFLCHPLHSALKTYWICTYKFFVNVRSGHLKLLDWLDKSCNWLTAQRYMWTISLRKPLFQHITFIVPYYFCTWRPKLLNMISLFWFWCWSSWPEFVIWK